MKQLFSVSAGLLAWAQGGFAQGAPPPGAMPVKVSEQSTGKTHRDIPYARIPGVASNLLSLDIYTPAGPAKPDGWPVVMMVHGGGWRAGDKANDGVGRKKAAFFTAQGFVYVAVNYRLSPAVKHPVHAGDVACATAWVLDHIRNYGGDPARLSLMGHSAGAHLAALITTDESHLGKFGKSPALINSVILLDTAGYDIPRHMGTSSEGLIKNVIFRNAFGGNPKVWAEASPINHVQEGKARPRFLVFYTDRKTSGPISRDFVAALRKAGTPAAAVLTKGKTHTTLNLNIGQPDDGPSKLLLEFLHGKTSFPDSI